jgi:hypothetical protein
MSKASVQGARPTMNNVTLDGGDINDPGYNVPAEFPWLGGDGESITNGAWNVADIGLPASFDLYRITAASSKLSRGLRG